MRKTDLAVWIDGMIPGVAVHENCAAIFHGELLRIHTLILSFFRAFIFTDLVLYCSSGSCLIYPPERKRDPIPNTGIDPDDRCGILVIISKVDFWPNQIQCHNHPGCNELVSFCTIQVPWLYRDKIPSPVHCIHLSQMVYYMFHAWLTRTLVK